MPSLAIPRESAPDVALVSLEISDSDAINRVLDGNREMFEVIVRRYNQQLYRVGMAHLKDHAQTEDAMQNAYLKAFVNLNRFRGTASFATWLTRIMINECLMMLRRRKRFIMESLDDEDQHFDHEFISEPREDPNLRQDMKAVLEMAIKKLPRIQRAVYMLREVQQLSTDESAQSLGISSGNVKVILHRARKALKEQLMKSAAGIELFDYPACFCDPLTARVMASIAETDSGRVKNVRF